MAFTERTADWVITKAYQAFKGKATAPANTTDKYALMLSILDSTQDDWRSEPDTEWNSLYQTVATGTITATDTFDLDDETDFISKRAGDYITLTDTSGHSDTVKLVTADQLYTFRDQLAVARIGRTLKFSKAFTANSPYIGRTLNVPSYIFTDDITKGSDIVQCDDPMYLAYMLAAELARNDTVKAGQYNNLIDKAGERMNKMKQNNGGQEDTVPREPIGLGETWN